MFAPLANMLVNVYSWSFSLKVSADCESSDLSSFTELTDGKTINLYSYFESDKNVQKGETKLVFCNCKLAFS